MSSKGLLLFFAVLPVVLILAFVYKKDKDKEPLMLLLSFFFKGIFSCFLVLTISEILGAFLPFMNKEVNMMTFTEVFLYAFVGVALVEEFCKWLMVYFGGYNHREFDEIYDILVYSIFVSLGFAFFENLLYVFNSGSLSIAILRAVSAIPGHACDAVFMGYYLSMAKQCRILKKFDKEKSFLVKSIFIPAVLHGIYDFCLMSGRILFVLVFLVFVVYLYVVSIKKLNKLSGSNRSLNIFLRRPQPAGMGQMGVRQVAPQQNNNNFCTGCGTRLTGPFCTKCGKRCS
ncbi:MAG: PrsW family intramembrane metalloprotease [Bacilli bacterium]|nr:PrsW family intramembrane metalloprotease [Bacilli bacterium]